MRKNNICPKCGGEIGLFYMKEACPHCSVNLLYYNLDKRLEEDAAQAKKEVDAVNKFLNILKASSVASPLLIARLVLFFTPLASMCLPMYGEVSLITLIMGLVKGTTEISDVMLPLISMALVIVLSLVVIISSLFSVTKTGFVRNMIFSAINTVVFVVIGFVIGGMGIGWYVTFIIYILVFVMHILCDKKIRS